MIPASRRRLFVLYAVIGALLIALGGRLYYLQVLNGHSYVQLASQDQTQTVITPAVRGQILDDAGLPLVENTSSLVVTVNMMNLATQSDGGAAGLTGWPACSACPRSCSPRRSGCAPRTCPSRAGPARPTSPSR